MINRLSQSAILIGLTLLVLMAPLYAANQCYSADESKAEQLLRLHSELMVITVACHQGSNGENLVPLYTGFTKAHISILHKAGETLKRYYRAHFGGDGIAQLDKLRTKLGNEYGQKIADISAPLFCAQCRDMLVEMYVATPARIEEELQHLAATEKPYERMCTGPDAHVARGDE
jgi:hypothetical protein